MKTKIVITAADKYIITTEIFETVFKNKDGAATQIGFLQQEIISLRADNEELKDELEDCEGYDEEDDFEERSKTITEEDRDRDWDRDWDSYDQNHDNKRED